MKNGRIKILHVVFSLEPGGMENGLVNVASRLNPDEFAVDVCCLTKSGEFAARLPKESRVATLNKEEGFSWATVFKLACIIARWRPDVIHTHNLGPLMYSSMATGAGLLRPILHGEHGFTAANQTRSVYRFRFFYGSSKKVHAVSEGLRAMLVDLGLPKEKTVVILNGVDTKRFAPKAKAAARAELGMPLAGPVLGIVGRFDRQKRHLTLIDAFDRLAVRFPTAQLVMVGDGGDRRDEVLARRLISPVADRIHLAGFQREPAPYYQTMDLLVSPSLHEGLSNVVLEGMACGVPALTHIACGNSEIVVNGENGWVTDLETVGDLAAELERVLAAPEQLSRMGQKGLQTVKEHFSMEAMVENYAVLYRELAGKKS